MVPSTYKMAFISVGVAVVAARFLTKKPTSPFKHHPETHMCSTVASERSID